MRIRQAWAKVALLARGRKGLEAAARHVTELGPLIAFLVSAIAFGIGHLGNDHVSAFAVFCIALEARVMLGAFYALTGRLWISIGVHIGWNFTQGYLFGALVSGESLGSSTALSTARD